MGILFVPLIYDGYGIGHMMVMTTVLLAFITAPGIAYVQGATDQVYIYIFKLYTYIYSMYIYLLAIIIIFQNT